LFLFTYTSITAHFDVASNIIKLSDNKILEMTGEDVYATLELPTGPLEVHVASTGEPIKEYSKLLKQ